MSQKKAPPKRGFLVLLCGNEALFFQAFDQRRILRAGQGSFFVNVIASYCESICRRSQIFRLDVRKFTYCYYELLAAHTCHIVGGLNAFRPAILCGRFSEIFCRDFVGPLAFFRRGLGFRLFFVKYFSLKKASEFPFFSKGFSLPSAGIMHPCA